MWLITDHAWDAITAALQLAILLVGIAVRVAQKREIAARRHAEKLRKLHLK